jgi:hydrogenase maturation protease
MPLRQIIVGLGNPLLGDDGVGWHVAEALAHRVPASAVEVDCHAGGGLSLMERLVGFDRAILIDAADLRHGPTGSVYAFPLTDLANPFAGHLGSAHETSLSTALEVGRALGMPVPSQVMVVAVESPNVYEFSDSLTAPVAAAVEQASALVLTLLEA